MEQYNVTGMSCAACQARVEKAVSGVPGVTSCSVSLLTNSMGVEGTAQPSEIMKAVKKAGYGASLKSGSGNARSSDDSLLEDRETPVLVRRLILSAVFLTVLMYITMGHNMFSFPLPPFLADNHLALALVQMLLAAAVMIINGKFFTSGFSSLFRGAPNMDTLVALGSSVSFAWSTYVLFRMTALLSSGGDGIMELYHSQLYFESAAMIPALITVGKTLEARSKGKTTDALKSLMKLRPKTAVLIRDGKEETVGIEDLMPGDLFAVRPGESFPADGIIEEGTGAVDESALTGESVPVDKRPGDRVSAATINRSGYLVCRTLRTGEDTTLSQIIRMVSDAAATKAPAARIADKVSGIFVPAVIGISAAVLAGWLISGAPFAEALERAIAVLVISCPCALGLATPVAIMVGNGVGAKNGILFKTGEALENTGKAVTAVLDKTGTVTKGRPAVTDVIPYGNTDEERLIRTAASLEAKSEHPLAAAVTEYAKDLFPPDGEVTGFLALPGSGLTGILNGRKVRGGSLKYISSEIVLPDEVYAECDSLAGSGKTPLLFAEDNDFIGIIAVADTIKEDSASAISELKALGLSVIMLTGDNEKTAAHIGKEAGVDRVVAGVMPDGKEAVIRELSENGRVIMIGDGINDAPALTRADTGMAIGAGTDVAIDSADVVLVNSSLSDAAAAVRLSRRTLTNIRENLFWAFFYNIICIPLAAGLFGLKMSPMIGAAAMSLSSFTVCMNALRLNLADIRNGKRDRPLKRVGHISSTAETGTASGTKTAEIGVSGMMCSHCENTVSQAVMSVKGVKTAHADHVSGRVSLEYEGELDIRAIRKAVKKAGYEFKEIFR